MTNRSSFVPGEQVTVLDGTFAGMQGRIRDPVPQDGLVPVEIVIFGRSISLRFDAWPVRGDPMNEAAWLASCSSAKMLSCLRGLEPRLVDLDRPLSHRQGRLLACACLRLVEPLLVEAGVQEILPLIETHADGQPGQPRLLEASREKVVGLLGDGHWTARYAIGEVPARHHLGIALLSALDPQENGWLAPPRVVELLPPEQRGLPALLLRDVIGNPFRGPPAIDPAWLTWNAGFIAQFARTIYQERRFDDLPILGDALEEAGCADRDILDHCRADRLHVRGCWVMDLIRSVD